MSSITMIGVKELANMTVDLTKSAIRVQPVIRTYLIGQMQDSRGKRKWAKLAPATLLKKRRTKRPFDTLKREMWDSFTKKSHPYHDAGATVNSIWVGSKMPDIPIWQMEGTNRIPARSIEATREMADEIAEIIADDIIRSGS